MRTGTQGAPYDRRKNVWPGKCALRNPRAVRLRFEAQGRDRRGQGVRLLYRQPQRARAAEGGRHHRGAYEAAAGRAARVFARCRHPRRPSDHRRQHRPPLRHPCEGGSRVYDGWCRRIHRHQLGRRHQRRRRGHRPQPVLPRVQGVDRDHGLLHRRGAHAGSQLPA